MTTSNRLTMSESSTRLSSPTLSSSTLSDFQNELDLANALSLLPPTRRANERRIDGLVWKRLDKPANIRRGSWISDIWLHGAEYETINHKKECLNRWICDYYDATVTFITKQGNSNMNRHLKNAHNLVLKRHRSETEESQSRRQSTEVAESIESEALNPVKKRLFRSLTTVVNVDKMRKYLIQWVVQEQIPFSAVSTTSFRDFLLCLSPSLERYIPHSHSTVVEWVQKDFDEARKSLGAQLASSRSRIHISFDVWTSPACSPILGICGHFLGIDLQLKQALLGVKELEGVHSGENIAEVVCQVIQEWKIQGNVGVFIGDNATNVDAAVESCERILWDDEEERGSRRARCLAHIINLAAKAFLFGKDCEAFIQEMRNEDEVFEEDQLAQDRVEWRKKGVIGKFHNICRFIRQSGQRRQDFMKLVRKTMDSGTKLILFASF